MTTVTRDNGGKTDSLFTIEDLLLFHVLMIKVSNALCLLEFFYVIEECSSASCGCNKPYLSLTVEVRTRKG